MFKLKTKNIGIIKSSQVIFYRVGEHTQNPVLLSQDEISKIDIFFIETEASLHEYEEYPSLNRWEFYTLTRHKGRSPNNRYGYFSRSLKNKAISTATVLLSPFQENFLKTLVKDNYKTPPIFTYESLLTHLSHSSGNTFRPHMIFIRPFGEGLVITLLKNRIPVLSRHFKADLYMLKDFIEETLKYGSRYGILKEETEIISLDLSLENINDCVLLNFQQYVSALQLKWVSSLSLLQHPNLVKIKEVFYRKRALIYGNLFAGFCFLMISFIMIPSIYQFHEHYKHSQNRKKIVETQLFSLSLKTKNYPVDWQKRISHVYGRELTFVRAQALWKVLRKLSILRPAHAHLQAIVFKGTANENFLEIRLLSMESESIKIFESILQKEFPSYRVMIKKIFPDTHRGSQDLIAEKIAKFESNLIITEQKHG